MTSWIHLLLLIAEVACASGTDLGVVKYDFHKVAASSNSALSKRAGSFSVTVENAQTLYYINATIGTPGQAVLLQFDTASSDTWVSASSAAYCQQSSQNCAAGTFDPSKSSTYSNLSSIFNITYVDGTGSVGNYFADDISFGGVEINLQMGLATRTTIGTGIIGLAPDNDEAICSSSSCEVYPGVIDSLKSQSWIASSVFSVWLDDSETSSGSVLFGGIDLAKYHPPLLSVPMQPSSSAAGHYTDYTVLLTNFSLTTNGVATYPMLHTWPSGYSQRVQVVNGVSFTYIPDDLFTSLGQTFNFTYDNKTGLSLTSCNEPAANVTLDFRFGIAPNNPTIHIPLSQLYRGGSSCYYELVPASVLGGESLFGESFLRSAYVVYDLDNHLISLADTAFNATGSVIVNVSAEHGDVASIAASASAFTITVTSTETSFVIPPTAASLGPALTAAGTTTPTAATRTTPPASTSSSTGTQTPVPVPPKPNHAGAIAGGVVGGVAALAIIGGVIWYLYANKRTPSIQYTAGFDTGEENRDVAEVHRYSDMPKSY